MKTKLLFPLIAPLFITACNNPKENKSPSINYNEHQDTSNDRSLKKQNEGNFDTTDTRTKNLPILPKISEGQPIPLEFPFGCNLFAYPDSWDIGTMNSYYSNTEYLPTPLEKEMDKTLECFANIHKDTTAFRLLIIKETTFILSDNYYKKQLRAITHYNYRLPNINNYQVYYSFYSLIPYQKGDITDYFNRVGNLILYNPIDQSAKIINVYYDEQLFFYSFARLFYISDNTINLYDIHFDELETLIMKRHKITIDSTGKLTVDLVSDLEKKPN